MKKNPLPNKSTPQSFAWHKLRATIVLSCALTVLMPAHAQDPAAGQAELNFVGADIESVVKAIGHYTGRTFIIDPRIKGTINLVSEKPVSKAQAFQLLTSALRLQGYTVVSTEDFSKITSWPDSNRRGQGRPNRHANFSIELRVGQ
jgi:general secretion pathway protein D